ncbi:Programmed cell death 6-interacting protein [Lamellibrachia satsuma]|nr:Programmed cell death 6-interacting protein [Lamellibrachia satsuma]
MIIKSADKHESALEVLYRYHDQLEAIEAKFPIEENQIRINFKWQNTFDKESFFTGKRTMTIASGRFEKVCVLFNTAALQSQIAESQNLRSDDGLKLAAKLFQLSSGIFSHLKDSILSNIRQEPTPDLQPDTLNTLSALMLAQAQDCFCRKAMADKMKPANVARLCMQCSDFYADAMKLLQLESLRPLWPKEWIMSVAGKQAAFHALSEYYEALKCKEQKEFGEEIARLQYAKELIQASETRSGVCFLFMEDANRIKRSLAEAVKDNDFIYHAMVPERSALSPVGKLAIAKPLPYSPPLSSSFKDLFEKIMPLSVHQALSAFENNKSAVVNTEVGRLREATQLMNSILASLNLPAALEDLGGAAVPPSLLEKAEQIRQLGGLGNLKQKMTNLPDLLQRNKEILDEADRMLNEEESSDRQLKEQFKERWTRTPSGTLTAPIRSEAQKYRTILNNAMTADKVIKQRFNEHSAGYDLLSKSNAEIEKALPSSSPVASLKGSPVVQELTKLVEEVETIKAERDVIEKEIKEAKSDLSSKFMRSLAQDGAVDEETLSTQELDNLYSPLREQVSDSLHRQELLLSKIQSVNNDFGQARSQNQSAATREQKLKDLAAAFDSFITLKGNLDEGTKFYNDLTELLVKFQSKVSDLCFARRTEKEELLKDLQNTIAQRPTPAPPSTPSYQQPTGKVTPPPKQDFVDKQQAFQMASSTNMDFGGQQKIVPVVSFPRMTFGNQQQSAGRPVSPYWEPIYQRGMTPSPTPPTAPQSAPQSAPPQAPPPTAPQAAMPQPQPVYGSAQQPVPYPAYGGAMPYPVYPPASYVPPPMPQGYNPYAQYGYPPQQGGTQMPQYPAPQQPPYQQYPQQHW